jgi:hypothetical protein
MPACPADLGVACCCHFYLRQVHTASRTGILQEASTGDFP